MFIPRRGDITVSAMQTCVSICLWFLYNYINSEDFHVKRTMVIHIEIHVYQITANRPYPCVLLPLHNICDFSVMFKVWNSKKTVIQTIIYKYSTTDGEKHVQVIKTCFSNPIIHTYIHTLIIIITKECIKRRQSSECL